MESYVVSGGAPLAGAVRIQGAKNSALPILTACLLVGGESVIHNCPSLRDVRVTLAILEHLGCRVRRQADTVSVDAGCLTQSCVPSELGGALRSSVLFLGALLARCGEAAVACPGGCALGPRPVDLHLKALEGLGAEIFQREGQLCGRACALKGRVLTLPFPSVGATENAMLAAVGAQGTTVIFNAAREPEIVDLQYFLQGCGASVRGAGGSLIVIEGGAPLHPCTYTVLPDRIVTATYLSAVAAAGGEVLLEGADCRTVSPVSAVLTEAGCRIRGGTEAVWIAASGKCKGVRTVFTAPYPGFPTDAQPMVMAALCKGSGSTRFVETIFSSRYSHVEGLRTMGASIDIEGRQATVRGRGELHGAAVRAEDLRGGAALVVAALGAAGESRIEGLRHIDRGYANLEGDLRALGGNIVRRGGAGADR